MTIPLMYGALAPWFHLLSPPAEYADEAAFALAQLRRHVHGPLETLLELGSGGGNLASHLRPHVRLTLTDLSPEMLAISRTINPDAEHIAGDMRTLRLERTFDAVVVHDAIVYMTTEEDLRAAMRTAFEHLRPGGAALFEPDHVREGFRPGTDHGGEDDVPGPDNRPRRGFRYLEWTTDPDPADTTYQVDYAFLLRREDGVVEVHHDRHVEGLFPTATWLRLLGEVGFDAEAIRDDPKRSVDFIGRRPVGAR